MTPAILEELAGRLAKQTAQSLRDHSANCPAMLWARSTRPNFAVFSPSFPNDRTVRRRPMGSIPYLADERATTEGPTSGGKPIKRNDNQLS